MNPDKDLLDIISHRVGISLPKAEKVLVLMRKAAERATVDVTLTTMGKKSTCRFNPFMFQEDRDA